MKSASDEASTLLDFYSRIIEAPPKLASIGSDGDAIDIVESDARGFLEQYLPARDQTYSRRLETELAYYRGHTLARDILLYRDVIHWAQAAGISAAPGWGSEVGSLVLYTLGVTAIDPLPHGLLFERFVNERKPSYSFAFPMLFGMTRLGEIREYVSWRYGGAQVSRFCGLAVLDCASRSSESCGLHMMDLVQATKWIAEIAHAFSEQDFLSSQNIMNEMVGQFMPGTIEELVPIIAVCQPGPVAAGTHITFRERIRGNVSSSHPYTAHIPPLTPWAMAALEPVLAETFGLPVYQEQMMLISHDLAGFTYTEADEFRRIAAAHNNSLLAPIHVRFISGAVGRGMIPLDAESVYTLLADAAAHLSSKASSVAWATISWQTATASGKMV